MITQVAEEVDNIHAGVQIPYHPFFAYFFKQKAINIKCEVVIMLDKDFLGKAKDVVSDIEDKVGDKVEETVENVKDAVKDGIAGLKDGLKK